MQEGTIFTERVRHATAGLVMAGALLMGTEGCSQLGEQIHNTFNHPVLTALQKNYTDPSNPSEILAAKWTMVTVLCDRENGGYDTHIPKVGRVLGLDFSYFNPVQSKEIHALHNCNVF
jgi:hypothetical protein